LWLLPPSLLVGVLVAFHVGDTVIEVEQSNGSMIKVRIGDVGHTPQWPEADLAVFLSDCETQFKDGGCDKAAQGVTVN
jgi:hypothetical protein